MYIRLNSVGGHDSATSLFVDSYLCFHSEGMYMYDPDPLCKLSEVLQLFLRSARYNDEDGEISSGVASGKVIQMTYDIS